MKISFQIQSVSTIIAFSILSFISKAQSFSIESQFTKGFKNGFKEGFCYNQYKANCLAPLVPLAPQPTLYENKESYQDGFNRGFQTGLDLKRVEEESGGQRTKTNYQAVPKYRYKEYVPVTPGNAYADALAFRQTVLEGRTRWLNDRIQGIADLNYSLLFNLNFEAYNNLANEIKNLGQKLTGVSGDFADDKVFNQVISIINFPRLESEIYTAYRIALSQVQQPSQDKSKFNDLVNNAKMVLDTKPAESLKLIEEAERLAPTSKSIYQLVILKSYAYKNLKDFKNALVQVDKYLWSPDITDDEAISASYHKGVLLYYLNQPKDALVIFNSSLFENIDENITQSILFYKAFLYYDLSDYENALKNAESFLKNKLSTDYTNSYIVDVVQIKAASLREMGLFHQALNTINEIINTKSVNNPSLFGTRGKIFFEIKDIHSATQDFLKVTELDDKDSEAFYWLALCYKQLNQKDKACEALKKAIAKGNQDALKEYSNVCN